MRRRPSEWACVHLHVSSPPSEAKQLFVLASDEVDGGVLQQGREHEEQTHGHPDVDGLHVRHLQAGGKQRNREVEFKGFV